MLTKDIKKYSKNSDFVKYYYNLKYLFSILTCVIFSYDGAAEFSAVIRHRNHSDMLIKNISVLKAV